MSDWDQFIAEVSWFLGPDEVAAVGDPEPWTRGSIEELPELSALLRAATLTPVYVVDKAYELLAWGPADERRGWLCHRPHDANEESVPAIHKDFWKLCGGIFERFREPSSWWLNQNEVLTAEAGGVSVAGALSAYSWIWHDNGLEIPINPDEYYVAAVEANGNLTLVNRADGQLLLFAPDHSFTGVTPLAGCPPYSLLTINDVTDLRTWIEVCAAAWLSDINQSQ
jgi:hypothetical protein